MTLSERIKSIASTKNIKIAELERLSGISNGQIRRWDKSSPKVENVAKVAKTLNVTVDYLLGESDSPIDPLDLEVEEALNSMRSYQGQPISDEEREVMRGIIKGYLDNKNKK